jgi:hypothetical protein
MRTRVPQFLAVRYADYSTISPGRPKTLADETCRTHVDTKVCMFDLAELVAVDPHADEAVLVERLTPFHEAVLRRLGSEDPTMHQDTHVAPLLLPPARLSGES